MLTKWQFASNALVFLAGTLAHKWWVWLEMTRVCWRLQRRALVHDLSKFRADEAAGFVRVMHLLRGSTYGSDEYRATLLSIKPMVGLHYQRNSHHPEFYGAYPPRLGQMSVYDIVEMICDWTAATRRHADGDIDKSFAHNRDRFGIDPVSERLLRSVLTDR